MSFGRELKLRRELCEWTQAELAEKSGLTAAAICNYESDKRLPDLTSFKKLVDVMPWKAEVYLKAITNQKQEEEKESCQEKPSSQ